MVAAGPWTPEALGASGWRPSRCGASSPRCELPAPPRHAIEQAGVEALTERRRRPGVAVLASSPPRRLGRRLDVHARRARRRRARAAAARARRRYVPALRGARPRDVRACARPLSADGRPLLGPVPGIDGLHLRHRPRRRGGSRSGRGRRGSWRRVCWGGRRRSRRSWRRRASARPVAAVASLVGRRRALSRRLTSPRRSRSSPVP